MYRRIEIIGEYKLSDGTIVADKGGLFLGPIGSFDVFDAWSEGMGSPKALYKNCRFYFTEKGWKRWGHKTVSVCKKDHVRFRVITVKEKSVDVQWTDGWQVAVRPRKRR